MTDTFDNVASDSPYRTGYDSVTFVLTAPNTYTIHVGTAAGGGTSDVRISKASFTFWECGASASGAIYSEMNEGACPDTAGHYIETWHFDYTGSRYTATGRFQQYGADGSTADQQYGTFTAIGPPVSHCGVNTDSAGTATAAAAGCKVVLSGTVRARKCHYYPGYNKCFISVVPVVGQRVDLQGPAGPSVATTDSRGLYRFSVKKGSYTISLPASVKAEPVSRSVDARVDVSGLDFSFCPSELGEPAYECDLVQIIGHVIDVVHQPYFQALVGAESGTSGGDALENTGSSDTGYTNRDGEFNLFVPRGTVTVVASGDKNGAVPAEVTVDASLAVNVIPAPLKLLPGISINGTANPGRPVFVNLDQMPVQPVTGDRFFIGDARNGGHRHQGCTFTEVAPVTFSSGGRAATFQVYPDANGQTGSTWCADTYTAILYDSKGQVASQVFTIDAPGA